MHDGSFKPRFCLDGNSQISSSVYFDQPHSSALDTEYPEHSWQAIRVRLGLNTCRHRHDLTVAFQQQGLLQDDEIVFMRIGAPGHVTKCDQGWDNAGQRPQLAAGWRFQLNFCNWLTCTGITEGRAGHVAGDGATRNGGESLWTAVVSRRGPTSGLT